MLESVRAGLSANKGKSCSCLAAVALAKSSHYGPHSCSTRVSSGQSPLAGRLRKIRRTRSSGPLEQGILQLSCAPLAQFQSHSSSRLLTGAGAFGLAIRHALLPSRQLSSCVRENIVSVRRLSGAGRRGKGLQGESVAADSVVAPKSGMLASDGLRSESARVYARSLYGWWSSSWNSRSTRWLQGRHSVWLMFGVCACFSVAGGAPVPLISPPNPALADAPLALTFEHDNEVSKVFEVKADIPEQKQVHTDYTVTGVPGDGRCLFRAVAHGACLRSGKPAPSESLQRELADELRSKAVDELVRRRDETEWFIEGNFDSYTRKMRQPHSWGGEPELLMLSHVLKMPITVYMFDRKLQGLISIAEYGQEYGKDDPVRVLYHGFGHYEALQMPGLKL